MKYKAYEIYEETNEIVVAGIKDFEPKHVFECGQCFRWIKEENNSYTGVVEGRVINVSKNGDELHLRNANLEDFKEVWYDYFDLGRDYGEIKERVALDSNMKEAIKFGHGIRLLKQDFHEMLISFIISANNSIPRIMKTIVALSVLGGKQLDYGNKSYNQFPDLKTISDMGITTVTDTKMGFRAKYVLDTASKVSSNGLNRQKLEMLNTLDAKNELMVLKGVGSKVSDCVLLFSGIKYDVFPVDVWVKRVIEDLYLKKETSLKDIHSYGSEYFGKDCGFAQQYLFYYAREKRIGSGK